MRPRSEPKKDLLAIGFVAGLVAWYAGGSSALDRLLDVGRMVRFILLLAATASVLGVGYELWRGRNLKTALVNAALLAALCALLGSTLGALGNRHADRSPGRLERAVLTGFRRPDK